MGIKIFDSKILLSLMLIQISTTKLIAAFSGNYTINPSSAASSSNYQDFGSAVSDLIYGTRADGGTTHGPGITGNVTFNVANGVYNESITLSAVSNSSSSKKITFQSSSGDSSKVILTSSGNVITITDASYFTFNKITIQGKSSSIPVWQYYSISDHITFNNCVFRGDNSSYLIYNGSYYGGSMNHLIVNKCVLHCGGNYGVYEYAYGTYTHSVFTDNIVDSFGSYGFICAYDDSLVISGNSFTTNTYGSTALYIAYINAYSANNTNRLTISRNKIFLPNGGIGMYFSNNNYFYTSGRAIISNNFITIGDNESYRTPSYGIYNYSNTHLDIVFNSFMIYSKVQSSLGIYDYSSTASIIRNNNIVNIGGGAVVSYYYNSFQSVNYNNYYIQTTSSTLAYMNGTAYSDLAAWKSGSSRDSNSISANPAYLSLTNLRTNSAALWKKGKTYSGVSTDIDGNARLAGTPCIGASEYTAATDDAGIVASMNFDTLYCGTIAKDVYVDVINNGSNTLTSVTINWKVNGSTQTAYSWTGALSTSNSTKVKVGSYSFSLQKNDVKIWTSSPNGTSDGYNMNDTFVKRYYKGLSGTFTVGGSSPDYLSINNAIKDLNLRGICGPIKFNIRNGVYNEAVVISLVKGVSSTNTITFQSQSGDSSKVVLQSDKNPLTIENAQYFTFKGMTIQGLSGSTASVYSVIGYGDYNTFTHCILRSGGSSFVVYNICSTAPNDHFTVTNCVIHGQYGIYNSGSNQHSIFTKNIIDSFAGGYGILTYSDSVIIANNYITESGSGNGIYCYGKLGNIIRNFVNISNGGTGIRVQSAVGGDVSNNFISMNGVSTSYGLYNNSCSDLRIIHNNINVTEADLNSFGFYSSGDVGSIFRNNNIVNSGQGSAINFYYSSYNSIDYNNYFIAKNNDLIGYWNNVAYPNITSWKNEIGIDTHSISVNPQFVSKTNLHTRGIGIWKKGTTLSGLLKDIDGENFDSPPTLGADEFSPVALDAEATAISYPSENYCAGTSPVKLDLTNNGLTTLTTVKISWKVNSTLQTDNIWTGSLSSGLTTTINVGNFTFLSGQVYQLKIWISAPNGGTDGNKENDTLYTSDLYQGFSGTYTIGGSSPSFNTITDAINKLDTGGVCGPVIFNIRNGTYEEGLIFKKIPGISEINSVTFQSQSGDSSLVVLQYTGDVVTIKNAQYFTFKSLTIRNKSGFSGLPIVAYNSGSNFITFSHCILASQNGAGSFVVYNDCTTNPNNHFEVSNCLINCNNSTAYGIYDYAPATITTTGYFHHHSIFKNNIINDFTLSGISSYSDSALVEGNVFKGGTASYGIYIYENAGKISGNTVNMAKTGTGIYLGSNNNVLISNNFVFTNGYNGIRNDNYSNPKNLNVLHNSINVINGTSGIYGYSDNTYGGSATGSFRNNLIKITGGGAAVYFMLTNFNSIDYNNYFVSGGANTGEWNGNSYSTLAAWKSGSGRDSNAKAINPAYVSNSNLHTTAGGLFQSGIATLFVKKDIDAQPRNPVNPVIGADEFYADGGISAIDSPITNFCSTVRKIKVTLKSFSALSITSAQLNWSVNGALQTPYSWTGSLSSNGATNSLNIGTYNFSSGTNVIKVWTTLINGTPIDANAGNDTSTVSINVYPLPLASVRSDTTFCFGNSVNIGSVATSGNSYSWISNPSGFTSSTSNPLVSPTTTTTYTLTETITATGCNKSNSVVITVNPLPTANTGSNTSVCFGSSTSIGSTAVVGNTYSWVSNPSGFTSTSSNPSVSPTTTTTYTLTETKTSTGCSKSNSVVVTVNPLPIANAGTDDTICSGAAVNIGAAAVSGNTYSWVSNPGGFTSTSANLSVSPTVTTTYTLTETITATGCKKSTNVIITVNPLPAANAGSNAGMCSGDSVNIGATAVSGNTYSWVSSPVGFASTNSNPKVGPTVTTTYTLTETISATGCSKSNSVVVTVHPLPAASVGSNATICSGSYATIGATAVSGNTYSWISNPSGFTSSTSKPNVSPTVTTTYTLTETVTATGCQKSNSVIVTVNPLPIASVAANKSICMGDSAFIGSTGVSGNTYSWTSNPSGFASTLSNPKVSPTITTTYTLTETITSTGCKNSNSMVVTVNPLPSASVISNSAICVGNSISIGGSPVSGNSYSWVSNPSGFTSTSANPNVSPTITTTYTLTETVSTTGCKKSNSVIISVNPLPKANAGKSDTICLGSSAGIGDVAVSGSSYSWKSNPSGFTSTSANPTVSPTLTTTYILTETIIATGCKKSDSVIINVNPLPLAKAGLNKNVCKGSSVIIGSTAIVGNTYSWTSKPVGFVSTTSNPLVSPTITTTYYLTETITATGCSKSDSVIVILRNANGSSLNVKACDSYIFGGKTLKSSGTYYDTLTNQFGCDSILTLYLTMNKSNGSSATVKACDSYIFGGKTLTASGTYYDTLTNQFGCDSVLTLYLTINKSNGSSATVKSCDSYIFGGKTLTSSGTYYDTLTNQSGCDSVLTLYLTINKSNGSSATVKACDSYIFGGKTLTASGTYYDTLTNQFGCDSVLTLYLTINKSNGSSVTIKSCDSYIFGGKTLTSSGTYYDTLTNQFGCDSVLTLYLTINKSNGSSVIVKSCDSYIFGGKTLTASGTYYDTLTNQFGCDSVLTLYLTINKSNGSSASVKACDNYIFGGKSLTSSGTYYDTLTNQFGCDSVLTLYLTINNSNGSSATVKACDSYIFGGKTLTSSGTYYDTLINQFGCDSVLTLYLTINKSNGSSATIKSCDSYIFRGKTLTSSGTYYDTLSNQFGCDSVLTLYLTILNSTSSTLNKSACNSFVFGGKLLTKSGVYLDTTLNSQGCDSIITLNLTINKSTSSTSKVSVCNRYYFNGGFITKSGTYYDTLPNNKGCDSVITLNLTINTVNNGVTLAGKTLTATEVGATYQWLDCGNNTLITGQTNKTFTATKTGDYAVIVSKNTCIDTSKCEHVIVTDIEEEVLQTEYKIYPNPTDGNVTLELNQPASENIRIRIYDFIGSIVQDKVLPKDSISLNLNLSDCSAGVYIIQIVSIEGIINKKLVIE